MTEGERMVAVRSEVKRALLALERGCVPERWPNVENAYSGINEWEVRSIVQGRYMMWGLVDKDWTQALAQRLGDAFCLEVMAGRGWLARALSDHGCRVIATDAYSTHWFQYGAPVYNVLRMNAEEAIRRHPEAKVLIMSWPPYADPAATWAAEAWGKERPIVYVGESFGCTGDEEFQERFREEECLHMPNWFGIHSRCFIGRWT